MNTLEVIVFSLVAAYVLYILGRNFWDLITFWRNK